MTTVKEFIYQSYFLISANNPTVPLQDDDEKLALRILNQLLNLYASTGLMLTIAQTATCPLAVGQQNVVVGPPTFVPTPDIPLGRMANLDSAWLLLSGVTYPLIDESRDNYLASWKYEPLQGLPRFIIPFPNKDTVELRLYPAPSQFFQFFMRGKFQMANLIATDTLDGLPSYYEMYLSYALAKNVAYYKGRSQAWTPELEAIYREYKDIMEASSEVNTSITGDRASLLNGSWRVRAGI